MKESEDSKPKPDKTGKPGYNQLVPAVQQASKILFCLAKNAHSRLSLTEISQDVGIHKSKAYSILNTLMEPGLVVKSHGAKTYALGPALLYLSRSILDNMDLKEAASPYLHELAEATQSTALLGVISSRRLFIVAKYEASGDIGVTIRVGQRYPLTWGAHGKAIVAVLPAEERERVFAQGNLQFYGRNGMHGMDQKELQLELETCRELGYAKDLGGVQSGINAVSSPVFGSSSVPIGCLIVVGTFPAAEADPFGARAAETSRKISAFLGPTIESVYGLNELRRTRSPNRGDDGELFESML